MFQLYLYICALHLIDLKMCNHLSFRQGKLILPLISFGHYKFQFSKNGRCIYSVNLIAVVTKHFWTTYCVRDD